MPTPTADELFHALTAIAAMCAALFWMASAYGRTVTWPWQTPKQVVPELLSAHQAKWNGMAAAASAVTAIFQAIQVLYNSPFFRL